MNKLLRVTIMILALNFMFTIMQTAILEGAGYFINKPIRLADFVARIRLHEKLARRKNDLHWQRSDKGVSSETRRRIVGYCKTSIVPRQFKKWLRRPG